MGTNATFAFAALLILSVLGDGPRLASACFVELCILWLPDTCDWACCCQWVHPSQCPLDSYCSLAGEASSPFFANQKAFRPKKYFFRAQSS